eukprot:TRINITY_DN916_c0_g1_i17.p1 TRINITY_DN916_c0_g1~~TRINITY_DN916_c0_g1_i17.p1  ORF type:complete len:148 (+),score=23.87 TRINITY_DN916_c0_g1_i17:211-654(+)
MLLHGHLSRDVKITCCASSEGGWGHSKQEFMKKKKQGKLPKDARQKLLDWWNHHYKWPYPSNEKIALAESTVLDQKQINNWFINQRKRHWKPLEDMQFVVVDGHVLHAGNILNIHDVPNIWHAPLLLRDQKAHEGIFRVLKLEQYAD